MSDLWAVPVAVLLWAGLFIMARGAYRRVRADVPVLWLLWRDVARRTHRRLFTKTAQEALRPFFADDEDTWA
jgi:hypothetical protein